MTDALLWRGLALSVGDAVYAHWTDKDVWPDTPTPVERFALGPRALLMAQAWAIPATPYLPSGSWWRRVERLSDRGLAWVIRRVVALAQGDILDESWKLAWRQLLLPRLLAEVKHRQARRRRRTHPPSSPPIDVLETVRRLTGEHGQKRGREWWFHCPFHRDKTPSLAVHAEKSIWHCHGCQIGGGWKKLREMAA